MRPDRLTLVLTLFACWDLPRLAAGEGIPTILEIPFANRVPGFQVAEVKPDGRVRVEVRPDSKDRWAIAEGYYLMMVGPEKVPGQTRQLLGPARLIRVQVEEVGQSAINLSVSPGTASHLHGGEPCFLARPLNSSTAQLRSLPEITPIGPKPAESPADALALKRARSITNLREIGLALHNFASVMDHFPPAVIYGPDGKPWHSWRVLLLPYLEEAQLYNEYDFSQPWDSAKNLKLLDRMPDVYRDPVYNDDRGHFTHYAALVGTWGTRGGEVHTVFPASGEKMKNDRDALFWQDGPGVSRFRDVTDGTAGTLAVAPVSPERKIPWTKPEDITVGPDFPGLGRPGGIAAPYPTVEKPGAPRSAPVLKLDGSVFALLDTVPSAVLLALATRDGAEEIDFNTLPTTPLPPPRSTPPKADASLKIQIDGGNTRAWIDR